MIQREARKVFMGAEYNDATSSIVHDCMSPSVCRKQADFCQRDILDLLFDDFKKIQQFHKIPCCTD